MQITLNQVDIERAIQEMITRKVQFESGFVPKIDLKATRGPEGFTAVVELDEQTADAVKPLGIETKVKTARASKPPAQETASAAADGPADASAADAPAQAETAANDTAGAESGDQQEGAAEGNEEAQAEGAGPPPEGTEKPKSLFANLGKPRNS